MHGLRGRRAWRRACSTATNSSSARNRPAHCRWPSCTPTPTHLTTTSREGDAVQKFGAAHEERDECGSCAVIRCCPHGRGVLRPYPPAGVERLRLVPVVRVHVHRLQQDDDWCALREAHSDLRELHSLRREDTVTRSFHTSCGHARLGQTRHACGTSATPPRPISPPAYSHLIGSQDVQWIADLSCLAHDADRDRVQPQRFLPQRHRQRQLVQVLPAVVLPAGG